MKGWNGTARYEANNTGKPGGTSMSRCIIFRVSAVPAANEVIWGYGSQPTAARGWAFDLTSAAALRFLIANGTPATAVSPTYTIVAGDVGKLFVVFGTYDGANVRLYQATGRTVAQVGAGTAATGFTAANGTDDEMAGNNQAVNRPSTDVSIVAMGGSDTAVWTVPQMQAICDDVLTQGFISVAEPSEVERYLSSGVTPPGTWTATVGGINWAAAGANTALIVKETFVVDPR